MKNNALALLPIAELESRLATVNEALYEGLGDQAAEILSERAMFGDSGPGTAAVLSAYYAAVREAKELHAALMEARNVGPFAPVLAGFDSEDVPF